MKLTQLTGFSSEDLTVCETILDNLLERRITSGYNWYNAVPATNRIVTFSHIHETDAYRDAMLADLVKLGHQYEKVVKNMREKFGCFRWELDFHIRDEKGMLLKGTRIRKRDGSLLNLEEYTERTLESYSTLSNILLVGESDGWELNVEFKEKEDLKNIAELFIRKSSSKSPDRWPDAYDLPVLVLGEGAVAYAQELPDFIPAKRIVLQRGNNEISFIIDRLFAPLQKMSEFGEIQKLGFNIEACLANKSFIEQYVNPKQ